MYKLHNKTLQDLQQVKSRLLKISERCEEIAKFVDNAEDYSYQYNVKIVGLPETMPNESATTTTNLCLKLFSEIGATDITLQDIDIAHRTPSRNPSPDKPNAIVCRFVRRLAKNRVFENKKFVSRLTVEQLGIDQFGLDSARSLHDLRIRIVEHLSPREQTLFYNAKKFKNENDWKFCWFKNGSVFLRETEGSRIFKLYNLEQLSNLTRQE